MSRELHVQPEDGTTFLATADLLARLRAEFPFFESSHEEGVVSIEKAIEGWEKVNPIVLEVGPGSKGTGRARMAALLEGLRTALPEACLVRFGDDAKHCHEQSVVPPTDGFLIVADQPWQEALAERLARVLGYVAEDI